VGIGIAFDAPFGSTFEDRTETDLHDYSSYQSPQFLDVGGKLQVIFLLLNLRRLKVVVYFVTAFFTEVLLQQQLTILLTSTVENLTIISKIPL
jgi:hypothetical protein